jgi:hypothetical protein
MRDTTPTTTTVTYRTIYMPANAEPRTKTFKDLGPRIDSLTLARNWMQRNGIVAITIDTTAAAE